MSEAEQPKVNSSVRNDITALVVSNAIEAAGGLPSGGSLDAVLIDLVEARDQYDLWRSMFDNPPSQSKRLKAFKDIESLSEKLAKKLGSDGGKNPWNVHPYQSSALARQAQLHAEKQAHLHAEKNEKFGGHQGIEPMQFVLDDGDHIIDYGSDAIFQRVCESVWLLHAWAKAGREEAEQEDVSHWQVKGSSAQAWLIGRKLPSIYERHFKRPFGVSKPHDGFGPPGGPGIKFVQICAEALGFKMTPWAIEKTWDRYRKHGT